MTCGRSQTTGVAEADARRRQLGDPGGTLGSHRVGLIGAKLGASCRPTRRPAAPSERGALLPDARVCFGGDSRADSARHDAPILSPRLWLSGPPQGGGPILSVCRALDGLSTRHRNRRFRHSNLTPGGHHGALRLCRRIPAPSHASSASGHANVRGPADARCRACSRGSGDPAGISVAFGPAGRLVSRGRQGEGEPTRLPSLPV